VIACYVGSKYSGIKWKKWLKISFLCIAIAGMTGLYLLKKDSADGRILIWRSTWNMVLDKPIAGHGYGAFNEKYMLYQAEYFDAHPDSRYSGLADNVLHPFNEYLLVLAEYGFVGLGCLAILGLLFAGSVVAPATACGNAAAVAGATALPAFLSLLSLLSIAVFSCFSYPFKYPFTWVIVFLNIAVICPAGKIFSRNIYNKVLRAGTAMLAAGLLIISIPLTKAEVRWNTIARQSLAGKTVEVLPEYDKLYGYLGKNGLFLYNHAAELHEVKEYEKSLLVCGLCLEHFNDMDLQMLLADNYMELNRAEEAEKHLLLSSGMCPNRFMPVYQLVLLYNESGRNEKALALARLIIDKEVKIPSATVTAIKNEMQKLIAGQESRRTNVEPLTTTTQQPGQEDPSENEPPKGLLPP
jgi:tetratricopeptide (TPR) repeat protein